MKIILYIAMFAFFTSGLEATEKRIITSDGVDLYVKIEGKGTPCLYIHGGPGSGSYWFEQFFGDFMEQHFTMIYLDQHGVGRSTSPADKNFSMKRIAQDFEEVRKELGIESWVTMGHSFGGILQMGYLQEFPEAQKGMLMVNCTLNINESFCESWSPKAAEFLGQKDSPPCETDTIPLMKRMGIHINQLREKDLFWKMAYQDKKSDSLMNATYNDLPNYNYDLSSHALSIQEYWKDYKSATASTNIPVLFFFGTKDWMVGPDHYKEIEFPNMMLWKNEGGHIPFIESKAELSKAILTYKAKFNL